MIVFFALGLTLVAAATVPTSVEFDVDFSTFLSRADLVWGWDGSGTNMPTGWTQGGFFGNGRVGGTIFANASSLLMPLARTDVYDDRSGSSNISVGNNFAFDRPRLPIGQFVVQFSSGVKSATMRQVLWEGLVYANVTLSSGGVAQVVVGSHRSKGLDSVTFVEVSTSDASGVTIAFEPLPAVSSWHSKSSSYIPNPPPTYSESNDVTVVHQSHLSGSNHVVALQTSGTSASPSSPPNGGSNPYGPMNPAHMIALAATQTTTTYISISPVGQGSNPTTYATTAVQTAANLANPKLLTAQWWNDFWPQGGFLTVNNTVLESFFWIQIAKFACGTGAANISSVHDLQGAYTALTDTAWPDMHFDMVSRL